VVTTPTGEVLARFTGHDLQDTQLGGPVDVLVDPGRILILEQRAVGDYGGHDRVLQAFLDTAITNGPAGTTADPTPEFEFDATAGEAFDCSVDGGAFEPCSATTVLGPLPDGPHSLDVRAAVGVDWVDLDPAHRDFNVDTRAPQTRIDSPLPAASTQSHTFAFSADEAGAEFDCSLDFAPFARCSGPGAPHSVSGLAAGVHLFQVSARDDAGNRDDSPAVQWFSTSGQPPGASDRVPPRTKLTAHPKTRQKVTGRRGRARFEFTSSKPDSTFACRLDSGSWKRCASPTTVRVGRGRHAFAVRAVDGAGNIDPTGARWSWKVVRRRSG